MRRTGGAAGDRSRAGLSVALLAVAMLLFAPWLARPVHSHEAGCHVPAMAHAQSGRSAPADNHDAACEAACALCAQLSPARTEAGAAPARTLSPVRYARLEVNASHREPERATPPPR